MIEEKSMTKREKYRPTMSVTIDPDVLARTKAAAQSEGRSVSNFVEHALGRFLAMQELTR